MVICICICYNYYWYFSQCLSLFAISHNDCLCLPQPICNCHNHSFIFMAILRSNFPFPVMYILQCSIFSWPFLYLQRRRTHYSGLVGSLQYSQSVEMHSSPNPTLSHQTFSIPLHQIKPGPRLFDEMADALIRLWHERERKSFPSKILKTSFSPQLYLPRNTSSIFLENKSSSRYFVFQGNWCQ